MERMIQLQTRAAFGWPNCYRLSNNLLELIVTRDVGPRVLRCAFLGGRNLFAEFPATHGRSGGEHFVQYGGHRLWHAPEHHPRTYQPDNDPVTAAPLADGLRLTQAVEAATGIQKEIELRLAAEEACVTVIHRLQNRGLWEVELAPWALSAMAAGGVAILPLPPRAPHSPATLLPVGQLTLWSYTDLTDPRWTLGARYVLLRQDASQATYQKIGAHVSQGWAAYARDGDLFVKAFRPDPAATYPDRNSNVELFVNSQMLELETLGPLTRLAPGGSVEHCETWRLYRDVPPPRTDADVDAHIAPLIRSGL